MTYTDRINRTEESMLELIDMLSIPSPDRFVAYLKLRHCSELDIAIMLADLRRGLALVNGESMRLAKLELTYNLDFAVPDNQRFVTAQLLFNRLRSSIAIIRREVKKSCPIIRKQPHNPNLHPSIFERSVLTKGSCARDLFGISLFDDNVQALYYEQQALFANVILSLAICARVIKEEKRVAANPDLCVERLEDQCNRLIDEMKHIVTANSNMPKSEIQNLIEQMGKREYAYQNFHKASLQAMIAYAQDRARMKDQQYELPANTSFLFHDVNKAKDALLLINHFDELMPDNRKMNTGLKIRLYCNWCCGGKNDNPKEKYMTHLVTNYSGTKTFPQWHAVTTSKSGIDIMEKQTEFNNEAALLIEKYRNNSVETTT